MITVFSGVRIKYIWLPSHKTNIIGKIDSLDFDKTLTVLWDYDYMFMMKERWEQIKQLQTGAQEISSPTLELV